MTELTTIVPPQSAKSYLWFAQKRKLAMLPFLEYVGAQNGSGVPCSIRALALKNRPGALIFFHKWQRRNVFVFADKYMETCVLKKTFQ